MMFVASLHSKSDLLPKYRCALPILGALIVSLLVAVVLRPDTSLELSSAENEQIASLIATAEYQITPHAATDAIPMAHFVAPNRGNGWHVAFAETGTSLLPAGATPESAAWSWRLAFAGYGVGEATILPVGAPTLIEDANRMTYRWDDNIDEWWVNRADGLEHGFTIQQRPDGSTDDALVVDLTINSELTPRLANNVLRFENAAGQTVLRYEKLIVLDATGATVPAEMQLLSDTRLRLAVADADATYPLLIDPTVVSEGTRILSSDIQIQDRFGNAVSIDGDTLVVGAYWEDGGAGDPLGNAGAVYIFERNQGGADNWGQVKKLMASDAGLNHTFGLAVRISGDTVVVSTISAVYVFERNQGGADNWGQVKKLTVQATELALKGDTLVTGYDANDEVYIFERNQGGADNWGQVKVLTSSDLQSGDRFGAAISIDGDTLAVSASWENGGAGDPMSRAGAVYIFERNQGGADNWGELLKLVASDPNTLDYFGSDVSIDGDTLVAGSPREDGGTGDPILDAGSIYIFERNQGGADNWGEVTKLTVSDALPDDQLGSAVSLDGDTLVAGARGDEGYTGTTFVNVGAAYVFGRNEGGTNNWGTIRRVSISNPTAHHTYLGTTIEMSGDTFVGGAPEDKPDHLPSLAGSVYLFAVTSTDLVVDTTVDSNAAAYQVCDDAIANDCSLRGAISKANADTDNAYKITVPAGTYTLALSGSEDSNVSGDLDISNDVAFIGAGAGSSIVNGGGIDRVFDIGASNTITLEKMTITNGNTAADGGGIRNQGTLSISNSIISNNTAGGNGGGVINLSGGTVTLDSMTLSGNSADNGGGLHNAGTATIQHSTLSTNSATTAEGGAIYNAAGSTTVQNSTLSGNTSTTSGGAISFADSTGGTIQNSTFANNVAGDTSGSDIHLGTSSTGSIDHTIIGSTSGSACAVGDGTLVSNGYNLDRGSTCGLGGTGDLSSTDPLLGALADNGGGTQTHVLGAGSPAIDAGNTTCGQSNDQRGITRPQGTNCDIGAYESVVPGPGGVIADLQLWLRADVGVTDAGGAVTAWADQSSNGRQATQATGANQPIITTNALNGNPIMTFDGSDDQLTVTGGLFGTDSYNDASVYLIASPANTSHPSILVWETVSPQRFRVSLPYYSNIFWDAGSWSFSTHRLSTAWQGEVGTPALWSFNYSTTATPDGNNQDISRNGQLIASDANAASFTGTNQDFQIGGESGQGFHNGDVAEVIIYTGSPTLAQHNQIESYLALKYGVTIDGLSYVDGGGATIWNATTNSSYHNDVAGIGVDATSALSQLTSRSTNPDSMVTITGTVANLSSGEFLVWGNDNGATTPSAEVPGGYDQRLTREWKVAEAGDVGPVDIRFDLTGIFASSELNSGTFALLTDTDGDFSNATASTGATFDGNSVILTNVDLTDGQYFTLAYHSFSDVGVTKQVGGNPTAKPGDTLTYTLGVTNSGGVAASNVVVTDTLPSWLSVANVTTSGTAMVHSQAGGAEVFTISSLPASGSGTITITAVVNSSIIYEQLLHNRVKMTTDGSDSNISNNLAGASTLLNPMSSAGGCFTENMSVTLPGSFLGSNEWADFNGDGNLDLLVTGYNTSSTAISKLYLNDGSGGLAEDAGAGLTGIYNSSIASADYDSDGDIDLLLAGYTGSSQPVTKLYRNNGSGGFTEATDVTLTGVWRGSVKWADYDADGDLDLVVTGEGTSGTRVGKLYTNDGNGGLTENVAVSIVGVSFSSVEWGDYDGDGDLDLAVTGEDATITRIAKLYKNDGNGGLTEDVGVTLEGVASGDIAWGDYDGDGDLDLALMGSDWSYARISKIYENNGSGGFTEDTGVTLTGVQNGSIKWADYDGDGDLDLALTGAASGTVATSKLYKNDGSGGLTEDVSIPIEAVERSNAVWGDYDGDGGVDLLIAGMNGSSTRVIKLYNNAPCPTEVVVDKQVSDASAHAGDTITYTLTFTNSGSTVAGNVVLTDTIPSGISISSVTGSGATFTRSQVGPAERFAVTGLAGGDVGTITITAAVSNTISYEHLLYNRATISADNDTNLTNNTVGVSTSLNPASAAAPMLGCLTNDTTLSLSGASSSGSAWGDVDNDGDLDLVISGSGSGTAFYRNSGSGGLTRDFGVSFQSISTRARVEWGDYDNDGDLDLALAGGYLSNQYSKIYRNDGTGNFTEDTGVSLVPVEEGDIAWGDYDNDGDLDLVLTGYDGATQVSKLYQNDGSGGLTEDVGVTLHPVSFSRVAWADYDADGDLDLVLSGRDNTSTSVTKLYVNDGSGGLTEHGGVTLPGTEVGTLEWVDYDGDGDLDLHITGQVFANINKLFTNDGSGNLTEDTGVTNLTAVRYSNAAWGDYDGDGDYDVVYSGQSSGGDVGHLYTNDGAGNFTLAVTLPENTDDVSWGDYDGDGDIDLLITGYDPFRMARVYENGCPEIDVLGNNVSISDGDVTPASADVTDYGTIIIGDSLTTTFTLSNTAGVGPLTLTDTPPISVTGVHTSNFTLTAAPSTRIERNTTATFDLTFTPSVSGVHSVTVLIANNDPDENPYTFVLNGTGLAVDMIARITGGNLVLDEVGNGTNNHLTLRSDGTQLTFVLDGGLLGQIGVTGATGNGTNTLVVPLSSVAGSQIIINSGNGDDVLTIDLGDNSNPFTKQIVFNGEGQTTGDALALTGTTTLADAVYGFTNATDGTVDLTGNSQIVYTGLEPITATITATNVTLNYSNSAEMITVTEGTVGTTQVDSTAGEMVTFVSPTATLTLNAGATGDDTITIAALPADYAANVVIDGQSGSDTAVLDGNISLAEGVSMTVGAESAQFAATANLSIKIGSPTNQLIFSDTNPLALNNATLTVTVVSGFTPTAGASYLIIDNQAAASTVSGTFNGLAEGGKITWGSLDFYITYVGGDGNDVVLYTNTAPTAVDDTSAINEDAVLNINLVTNDTDAEGDTLSVTAIGGASNGTATISGTTHLIYTPTANFNGTETLTYTVSDGELTDTGNVTITVNAVNDAPVAVDNIATTNEDTPITVDVIANDTDVDLDTLNIGTIGPTTNGTATISGTATIIYTPTLNFNGTEALTYTVSDGSLTDTGRLTITVNAVNDAPVAVDNTATTNEDTPITVDVIANDTDVDLDSLSVGAVGPTPNGTATIGSAATIIYTPTLNFNGTEVLTYTVSDGGLTDTGRLTITINAVNDAPVAVDNAATTNEDTPITVDVIANDTDVELDSLSIGAVGPATNGTATISGTATIIYTPTLNFNGTEVLTYTVSDGSLTDTGRLTITVNAVNDTPVAVDDSATINEDNVLTIDMVANDTDVDGDVLTVTVVSTPTNGTATISGTTTLIYTPTLNFNGTEVLTYSISDGSLTDSAILTITINPVNDAPVAVDDSGYIVVPEEITLIVTPTIGILSNDSDVEGDSITSVLVTDVSNGVLELSSDGSFVYTPTLNFFGADLFTYTAFDGSDHSAPAVVTITVTPIDDPVIAVSDMITITEDGGSTPIDVLANDIDPDNDPLVISAIGHASNGNTGVLSQTMASYNPHINFYGTDTFTYTVHDGAGNYSTAIVTVTVLAANDDPVAVDDAATIQVGTLTTIDVLANDDTGSDAGETVRIVEVTQGLQGQVAITNDGADLSYQPSTDYIGLDSFSYTIDDGSSGRDTATVTVNIVSAEAQAELTVPMVAAYPSTVCKGQYFGLLFQLQNWGTMAADTHTVYVYDEAQADVGFANQIAQLSVTGPGAEQSGYFSISSSSFITGTRYIKVVADGDNVIVESLEENNSNYTTLTVTPDDVPTGTILINSGDIYATDSALQLALSATDAGACATHVARMRFAYNGTITVWEPYTTTKTLDLIDASGDTTVAVQYQDANNNFSPFIRENIIVDVAPPASRVIAPGNSSISTTLDVAWSGTDSISGVQDYDIQYNQDGAGWADWQLATILTTAQFEATAGSTYCFRSRARDMAGNQETYPTGEGDICVEVELPLAGVDLSIQNMQFNQAIQTPSNAVPLIANKPMVVEVVLGRGDDLTPIDALGANLHGFRGGVELDGSPIQLDAAAILSDSAPLLHFTLPSDWLNGTLELAVEIDPDNAIAETNETNNRYPASGTEVATFNVVPDMEITVVPIIWDQGGRTLTVESADLLAYFDYLRKIYPTANVKVGVHSAHLYVADTIDWLALLSQIDTLRATELPAPNDNQKYVGLLPVPDGPISGPTGLAYQPGSTAVGYAMPGGDVGIAHEVAHALGVRDVVGNDASCRPTFRPNSAYPYADGTIIYHGWDYEDEATIPGTAYDLMAYCDNSWISDFTYQALYNVLTDENVPAGSTAQSPTVATANESQLAHNRWLETVAAFGGSQRLFAQPATTAGSLLVTGLIAGDGTSGEISAAFGFTETAKINLQDSGDFRLVVFNQHGFMTDVRYFDVPAISNPDLGSGLQPYNFLFADPPQLGAIRLYFENTLLAENLIGTTPQVTITSPIPDTLPEDNFTLTWSGVVDQLYVVRYSADGGNNWTLLTPPITETTYTLNVATLPGTVTGMLEVVASTGLHSAIDRTQTFTIPNKAPQVAIASPVTERIYGPDDLVTFSGNAFDFEDGSFADIELKWISSIDGEIGTGQLLATRDLSLGRHIITLQVTDSNGVVGTRQIEVTIPVAYLPVLYFHAQFP